MHLEPAFFLFPSDQRADNKINEHCHEALLSRYLSSVELDDLPPFLHVATYVCRLQSLIHYAIELPAHDAGNRDGEESTAHSPG